MDVERIRELRQSTTAWQMSIRDTPPRCDPARRYRVLLIVSPGANKIRHMEAVAGAASDETLAAALGFAMLQGPNSPHVPARPAAVVVDDDALAARIRGPLEACGITVELSAELSAIDPVIHALSTRDNLFSTARAEGPDWAPASAGESADDDDVMPSLITVEHAVSIARLTSVMLEKMALSSEATRRTRALVIHCAEGHADAISEALAAVNRIAFTRFEEEGREFELVVGLRDDELLGAVTVCPVTDDRPPLSEQFARAEDEEIFLVVAVGPPGRLRTHEIAHGQRVSRA
jgi:hypothetical protein